jgi:hypothetical protein
MMVLGWLSSHSREGPALAEFIYIPSRLIYERCCIVMVWRESQALFRWTCASEAGNREGGVFLAMLDTIFQWMSRGLALLALAAGIALLLRDATPDVLRSLPPATLSAAPLLLVGAAFLILQPVIRARRNELLKNMVLAGTFLLWGAIQLMPQNAVALRLGNLVIALYVLDLAWVILGSKSSPKRN